VILGAERVTKGYKRKLRELLMSMGAKDPEILSTYGFTEARVAWLECLVEDTIENTSGYHLYPDLHIFEIVNPDTGEPVGDGESGEIVITNLGWRGSVVIRYRTGDYANGGIVWDPCPDCGRSIPRLTTNLTRLSDQSRLNLGKVKGTLVDFNEFFPIMHDQPEILEWQIEISKRNDDPHDMDVINAHLCVKEGVDLDDLTHRLQDIIKARMELIIGQYYFRSLEEINKLLGMEDRTKELRIRDKRKELESLED
jgi:phenylacetate-CoA ligase